MTDLSGPTRPLVAGNWKMNTDRNQAVSLAKGVLDATIQMRHVEIVLCPPFCWLTDVAAVLAGSPLRLGAQNMHWSKSGAFTGEISPLMLKEIGCHYVILGHSERRQYFGETDAMVNKKLKAAIEAKICPIVCLGETLAERDSGQTEIVVKQQFKTSLDGLTDADGLVIAYEPVWAIGTGKNATPEQVQEVHTLLRQLLAESGHEPHQVRILYGGSVNPENATELMSLPDVDGFLVGGASLKQAEFTRIAAIAESKASSR